MAKNLTQYFAHDYNARNDMKMQNLLAEEGMEGIGIYWCVIEMLYEAGGKLPLKSYKSIAFALHVNYNCIRNVIEMYDLFDKDEEYFWSNSVLERLEIRENISNSRRNAVLTRWKSTNSESEYKSNTNVPKNDTNVILIKENKKKENKVSDSDNIIVQEEQDSPTTHSILSKYFSSKIKCRQDELDIDRIAKFVITPERAENFAKFCLRQFPTYHIGWYAQNVNEFDTKANMVYQAQEEKRQKQFDARKKEEEEKERKAEEDKAYQEMVERNREANAWRWQVSEVLNSQAKFRCKGADKKLSLLNRIVEELPVGSTNEQITAYLN